MRLVIDIQKEMYEQIIDENGIDTMLIPFRDIILNGIPLPKDHGDLIDSNGLKASMACYMRDMTKSYTARYVMSVAKGLVDLQKTIIKADEGE